MITRMLILLAFTCAPVAAVAQTVCFTPGQDCTGVVVHEIDSARSEVLMQAYGLSSRPILDALEAAKARGVVVRVLVDRSQRKARWSGARRLAADGVDVRVDERVAGIAHSKVLVIDRNEVLTGSFNWTRSAETRNVENLLVLQDKALAAQYTAEWQQRSATASAF